MDAKSADPERKKNVKLTLLPELMNIRGTAPL
jgi:hypothetical protein